jgi:hypothetical protein
MRLMDFVASLDMPLQSNTQCASRAGSWEALASFGPNERLRFPCLGGRRGVWMMGSQLEAKPRRAR